MSKSNQQVFLSYSHSDRAWVEQFANALRAEGLNVWFDVEAIKAGDRWADLIQDALRNSRTLVLVLGPHNIKSRWMFFELGAALADGKRIIPILLGGLDFDDLPRAIRKLQALRASSPAETSHQVACAVAANSDVASEGATATNSLPQQAQMLTREGASPPPA